MVQSQEDTGEIQAIEDELTHYFEDLLARVGNRRLGTLYSRFLFTERSLTQKELAEDFGRTQSTISRDLNYLEMSGLVQKSRDDTSREWLYTATADSVLGLITNQFTAASHSLQEGVVRMELMKRKLEKLNNMVRTTPRAKRLQEMLDSFILFMEIMSEELEDAIKKFQQRLAEENRK